VYCEKKKTKTDDRTKFCVLKDSLLITSVNSLIDLIANKFISHMRSVSVLRSTFTRVLVRVRVHCECKWLGIETNVGLVHWLR